MNLGLRLGEEEFRQLPWSALVLDEAQAVKNPRSKTHRAVRGVGGVRTFVLTGTPLENSLTDLWAMFSLAVPGLFGSSDRIAVDIGRQLLAARRVPTLIEL